MLKGHAEVEIIARRHGDFPDPVGDGLELLVGVRFRVDRPQGKPAIRSADKGLQQFGNASGMGFDGSGHAGFAGTPVQRHLGVGGKPFKDPKHSVVKGELLFRRQVQDPGNPLGSRNQTSQQAYDQQGHRRAPCRPRR